MTRKHYPPKLQRYVRDVPYEATTYWPVSNILKTNCNVFNPAIRITESPDWAHLQTRADTAYHSSKNADSRWTTGGEFISAVHRGLK